MRIAAQVGLNRPLSTWSKPCEEVKQFNFLVQRVNHITTYRRTPTMQSTKKKSRPPVRPARASPAAAATVQRIPIDAIDWSFAIRPINLEHVDRLAAATELPPIKVWQVQTGKYRGIDGYHRWRLAKNRGNRVVEASNVRFPKGERGEKAFEFECVRSNLQHGLPLTREQRDRAIVRIWNRWGRATRRSENGVTLDQLGKLFNLTKPRIHQIVSSRTERRGPSGDARSRDDEHADAIEDEVEPTDRQRPVQAHPGGFSSFGRFSSATARISKLLADEDFVVKLFRERNPEVLRVLVKLRALIDTVVTAKAPPD